MKYFNYDNNEITEAEYTNCIGQGKRFSEKSFLEVAEGRKIFHPAKYQFTPAKETQRDVEEAQQLIDNPHYINLAAKKVYTIKRLARKAEHRFEKYVDKHYAKATRRGSDTIPEAVKDYANALDTAWDTIKEEVNACATRDECNIYRVGEDGNTDWPDASAVQGL